MASNIPKNIRNELHEYLQDRAHWRAIAKWLLIGLIALILIVWFGKDAIEEIETVETWIEGHGVFGWIVFVCLIVLSTSVFVPISLLAIAGGTMYGILGASILTFLGVLLTAALNYVTARSLFRTRIEEMLGRHRKLKAIQQAADREGLRLQLLLEDGAHQRRVGELRPGASGVRFFTFLIAMIGLLPSIIVNVYFGYTASHMTKVAGKASEHSTLHTVVTVVGLLVCVVVMVLITRIATKAIAAAENEPEDEAS